MEEKNKKFKEIEKEENLLKSQNLDLGKNYQEILEEKNKVNLQCQELEK